MVRRVKNPSRPGTEIYPEQSKSCLGLFKSQLWQCGKGQPFESNIEDKHGKPIDMFKQPNTSPSFCQAELESEKEKPGGANSMIKNRDSSEYDKSIKN